MSVSPVAHPRARDQAGDDQRWIGREDGSVHHGDRGQRAKIRRERGDRLLARVDVPPPPATSSRRGCPAVARRSHDLLPFSSESSSVAGVRGGAEILMRTLVRWRCGRRRPG
jgi:hypothetical protein